jgi:hypothetical protein
MLVRVAYEFGQAFFLCFRPGSGIFLACAFDNPPAIVPPAMVVVCGIRGEHLGRSRKILCVGTHGAEKQQTSTDGQPIVEHHFLCVRFSGQHQNRPHIERLQVQRIGRFWRAGKPFAIFAERFRDGREMLRFLRL